MASQSPQPHYFSCARCPDCGQHPAARAWLPGTERHYYKKTISIFS